MRNKIPIILVLALFSIQQNYSQNAPVATAGTFVGNSDVITIPITVTGFNNIGSCNLRLLYDPSVVSAVEVTAPAVMGENLSYNVSTPGLISWGWYYGGGLTIPDNSVAFYITFNREVEFGESTLAWDNSQPYYCTWSNASSVVLDDTPAEDYYLEGLITIPTAPVTIAPDVESLPLETVEVPVTVIGFQNVGVISLTLLFDPDVLTYNTFINNSGFSGLQVNNPNAGVITVGGFSSSSGLTLPDYSTLFTIVFDFAGGYSDLTWFDNGTSCEYAGFPDYNPYHDTPTSTFYIDGSVSEIPNQTIDLKVFLEGLYNITTSSMNKAKDYVNDLFVDRFPGTIADQITIELYENGNYGGGAVFSATGVDLNQDGTAQVFVPLSFDQEYYITVKSRNHLETVSATAIDFGLGNVSYDFTTFASQAYGDNQVALETGVYGLYVGDIDQNGVINVTDRASLNIHITNLVVGYVVSDLDGNGSVNVTDRAKLNVNIYKVITKLTP
jgi:hypothetical protein